MKRALLIIVFFVFCTTLNANVKRHFSLHYAVQHVSTQSFSSGIQFLHYKYGGYINYISYYKLGVYYDINNSIIYDFTNRIFLKEARRKFHMNYINHNEDKEQIINISPTIGFIGAFSFDNKTHQFCPQIGFSNIFIKKGKVLTLDFKYGNFNFKRFNESHTFQIRSSIRIFTIKKRRTIK